MGIKNFFVKVKPVKFGEDGMLNLLKYFVDEKRHPDGIINFKRLSDWEKFFIRVHKNVNGHNVLKKINGIRGRNVKTWGDSYVFSFPKGLEIEKQKMGKIINELLTGLYGQFKKQLKQECPNCDISFNDFIDNVFLNIHTNQHIHINVVFSRIIPVLDKETKKYIFYTNRITNRKKFLNVSKGLFNKVILDNFEIDIKDYKPTTNFKKGYKSIYIKDKMNELDKKITELKETEKEVEKRIYELDDFLKMKRKERKEEVEKLIQENDRKEKIVKSFNLMIRYFVRFMEKIQNNEIKSLRKDYNLIMDKVEELEEITKNKQIRKMTEQVKEKTKRHYGRIYGVKM
jgi:hypothetical protein